MHTATGTIFPIRTTPRICTPDALRKVNEYRAAKARPPFPCADAALTTIASGTLDSACLARLVDHPDERVALAVGELLLADPDDLGSEALEAVDVLLARGARTFRFGEVWNPLLDLVCAHSRRLGIDGKLGSVFVRDHVGTYMGPLVAELAEFGDARGLRIVHELASARTALVRQLAFMWIDDMGDDLVARIMDEDPICAGALAQNDNLSVQQATRLFEWAVQTHFEPIPIEALSDDEVWRLTDRLDGASNAVCQLGKRRELLPSDAVWLAATRLLPLALSAFSFMSDDTSRRSHFATVVEPTHGSPEWFAQRRVRIAQESVLDIVDAVPDEVVPQLYRSLIPNDSYPRQVMKLMLLANHPTAGRAVRTLMAEEPHPAFARDAISEVLEGAGV